ncbi:uncharacterized protein IUM83_08420 [Phytophthora cinnamomi]|uniref:uncharacterized protein n=1 Tax=Phytophthora cinnamomi TaxID=4785 RepID=UPI003559A5C4|nr:hypothetical protein IUM83_08420 [Phytophthora cinnamomi]
MELTAAIGEETPATHSPASSALASPSSVQEQVEPQRKKAALEKEIEALQARLEEISSRCSCSRTKRPSRTTTEQWKMPAARVDPGVAPCDGAGAHAAVVNHTAQPE